MLEKLEAIHEKFLEIEKQMNDPEVMNDMKHYVKLSKDYKDLQPIIAAYKEYKNVLENIENAKFVLNNEKDEEFKEMAKQELGELTEKRQQMEDDIRLMLIPSDPQDGKNAVFEIRAGTGGDEASIFAGDLYRMYTKFFEKKGWKTEIVDFTEGTVGGYKEIVLNVSGEGVYGQMKYESGGRTSRSRGVRCRFEDERHSQRHFLFVRSGRSIGQYNLFCNQTDTHSHRHCGFMPRPEVSNQELRQGSHRIANSFVRVGIQQVSERDCLQTKNHGIYRRPFGKNQNIQLPSVESYRPQNKLDDVQSACVHGRRNSRCVRCSPTCGKCREIEGSCRSIDNK